VEYLINVGSSKRYTLSLRLCNTSGTTIDIFVDGKKKTTARLASTGGKWVTQTVNLSLTSGNHKLRLNNIKQSDNRMNWLRIEGEETGIVSPLREAEEGVIYDLSGRPASKGQRGLLLHIGREDGHVKTRKILSSAR
jgi:hypothetical protein